MGIRRKMFLPIAAAFVLLGGASLAIMYFRLDGLERNFISQIVANKTREVENAIDTASRMTLEQAALFARLPVVEAAYGTALSGDIHDEKDPMAQKAREELRQALTPFVKGFAQVMDGRKFQLHYHLANGRSLVRLWRDKQVTRDGKGLDISDDLSAFRPTVMEVNRTGKPLMGIELGEGGFVFRGIAPVASRDGKHLGSVEVLSEFSPLLAKVAGEGQDMALYMNAEFLKITGALRDPAKNPVLDGRFVQVSGPRGKELSAWITADFLEKAKNGTVMEREGNRAMAGIPINDYKGQQTGILVFSFSTTAETSAIRTVLFVFMGLLLVLLAASSGAVHLVFVKSVARPIEVMIAKIRDITEDRADLTDRLDESRPDEMGQLAAWFNRLTSKLSEIMCLSDAVLNAMPDPLFVSDEKNRIIFANLAMAEMAGKTASELKGAFCGDVFKTKVCGTPDCPIRCAVEGRPFDPHTYVESTRNGERMVIRPLVQAMRDCHGNNRGYLELAQDVTPIVRKEEELAGNLSRIEGINAELTDVAATVAGSLSELSHQSEEVRQGAETQRQRMSEVVTAMDQMSSAVLEVAKNAGMAAQLAGQARERAARGVDVVGQAVTAIGEVRGLTLSLRDGMEGLGRRAVDVGQIMNVISDIADQTNLLALNAAIEAARAGEAGRGFAVVADEVRKLAEKTMNATGEVARVVAAIQEETRKSADLTQKAAASVERATELSNDSGRVLDEISGLVGDSSDQVQAIATAAEQQSAASDEINKAIGDVDRISSETAQGMDHSAQAISGLTEMAGHLRRIASSV
ncbi:methyl-accepting chemotaxis protein [Desulfolutivibrio sulfoxidireducens]|uniref:methyl-accepting chemotaxis protein n=1 Tax=Desulfolutivibrio sulfoxidireducens TaxID=2773299 RepID=UPI00159E2231|nr:methyl-accepting chemotaxis protein [Desulfolutivibrio sulfoxidireducens]QLA18525.1 PAS domain-containing protein [Desulfolutivibrio sulfoxidireducens]